MHAKITHWNDVMDDSQLEHVFSAAMESAARALSGMVGRPIAISTPRIERVPISQAAAYAGGPETEMVGVYLLLEGDMPGQAILMFTLSDALSLVDFLLGAPPGTSTQLGEMERSALAEVGNLAVSHFLNTVAELTETSVRPSPPAVMVDMLGAILDVVATSVAAVSDDMVIVETAFEEPEWTMQAPFWVLPTMMSLDYQK